MKHILSVKEVIYIALLVAILSIMSNITININVIPITFSTLALMIIGIVFDLKITFFVSLIYILLGIIGIPVFSNMRAGLNTIFSLTGGFIIGYIPFCVIISVLYDRFENILYKYFVLILSNIILYTIGTMHYSFLSHYSFINSLRVCVVPFILVDNVKIIFAIIVSKRIHRILKKSVFDFGGIK